MEHSRRYFTAKIMQNEYAKILFQYCSVTITSILTGAFLARSASLAFLCERAVQHFALPFQYCTSFREIALEFFCYSCSDLICASLLLLSSFSLLNCLCSDLVLGYQGLRLGLLITANISLRDFGYLGERWLLFLLRVGITACFLFYAYRLSRYSYEIRKTVSLGRITLAPKNIVFFLKTSLFLFGSILLLIGGYCGFIFLI